MRAKVKRRNWIERICGVVLFQYYFFTVLAAQSAHRFAEISHSWLFLLGHEAHPGEDWVLAVVTKTSRGCSVDC